MENTRLVSLVFLFVIVSLFASKPSLAQQHTTVKDFVHQIYIHGVPYEIASKYGSEDTSVLLEMLLDDKEQPYWSNIVITLGMIGENRAVGPMIEFINRNNSNKISPEVYTAKTSAIISLGYIINKTGNKKALDYLAESLQPNVWQNRKIGWESPFYKSKIERDGYLTEAAVLGLGLSGKPEAKIKLLEALQRNKTEEKSKIKTKIKDVVKLALKEHKKVSSMGLKNYQRIEKN